MRCGRWIDFSLHAEAFEKGIEFYA